jgi:hypothetical protein
MGKSLPVDLCSGSGGTAGSDRKFPPKFSERPIFAITASPTGKFPTSGKRTRSLIPLGRITMTMATMELFAIVLVQIDFLSPVVPCTYVSSRGTWVDHRIHVSRGSIWAPQNRITA